MGKGKKEEEKKEETCLYVFTHVVGDRSIWACLSLSCVSRMLEV